MRVATFPSASGPPQRQISSYGYTNLRFELGLEVGTPILNWVYAALKGNPITKNGTVIELDDQNRAKSYLDFTDGAIADFVVPGFDGSSSAANTFTLEASIGKSTFRAGDNTSVQLPNQLKPFLSSTFVWRSTVYRLRGCDRSGRCRSAARVPGPFP